MNVLKQQPIILFCLIVIVTFGIAEQTEAYFATASLYQGFDVDTSKAEADPTMLVVVVGVPENIKTFLGIEDLSSMLEFSRDVDFHFEFDKLVTQEGVAVAFLDNTEFHSITAEIVDTLEFETHDAAAPQFVFDEHDSAVLITLTGSIFKIGEITQLSPLTASFRYEQIDGAIDPFATPEPSTIMLFGVGILGLIAAAYRRKRLNGLGKTVISLFFTVVLFGILTTNASAYTLTAVNTTVNGTIKGDGINCGYDCTETYEADVPITLTAHPKEGIGFSGWSGACEGTETICTIAMDEDKVVRADFGTLWQAEYFNGSNISGTVVKQEYDAEIAHSWGTGYPGATCKNCWKDCHKFGPFKWGCKTKCSNYSCWGMNADDFSVRWTKQVQLDMAGQYRFIAKTGDKVSVFVDEQAVLNLEGGQTIENVWETIDLSSGTHNLRVEYYHAVGNAQISFRWGKAEDFAVLTINKSEFGDGTVSSADIVCGEKCRQIYDKGTELAVNVQPDTYSTFREWQGACSGSETQCALTLNADTIVTANFDTLWKVEYFNGDVSGSPVRVSGAGGVDEDWGGGPPGGICKSCKRKWYGKVKCKDYACWGMWSNNFSARWTRDVFFGAGHYTFVAKADDVVRVWFDDMEIINRATQSSLLTSWTTIPVTEGIHQVKVQYHDVSGRAQANVFWDKADAFAVLTVSAESNFGHGIITGNGIRCGENATDCQEIYYLGDTVQLAAGPNTESVFGEWEGACEGIGACEVEIVGDTMVAARFDAQWQAAYIKGADLTAAPVKVQKEAAIDHDWGTNSPGGTCRKCSGHWFWKRCYDYACWNLDADNFSVQWTKQSHFDAGAYTFVANADDSIRVWVDDEEILDDGQAQAITYWKTVEIPEGDHTVRVAYHDIAGPAKTSFKFGKSENFSILAVVTDSNLGTGQVVGPGIACEDDCQEIYYKGENVTLTAKPEAGSMFGGWGGPCKGRGDCVVTVDATQTVVAKFESVWQAEYFDNPNFVGTPMLTRSEDRIDFTANQNWELPGIDPNNFSVRWTRQSNFEDGDYTFVVNADNENIRVRLDNAEIVNADSEYADQTYWNIVPVTEGVHDLEIEYASSNSQTNAMVKYQNLKGRTATLIKAEGPACVKKDQLLSTEDFKMTFLPSVPEEPEFTISPAIVPAPNALNMIPVGFEMPEIPLIDPGVIEELLAEKLELPVGWVDVLVSANPPNAGSTLAISAENGLIPTDLPNISQGVLVVDESQRVDLGGGFEIGLPGLELDKCGKIMQSVSKLQCLVGPSCKIDPPKFSDLKVNLSVAPLCCPDMDPAIRPSVQVTGNGNFSLGSIDCQFFLYGIPYILELGAYLEAGGNIAYSINGITECRDAEICGGVGASVYVGGGVYGSLLVGVAKVKAGIRASVGTEDGKLCYHTDRGLCLTIPKACAEVKVVGSYELFFGLYDDDFSKTIGKTCSQNAKIGKCF